ncbi:MAG: hypothetical protein H7287_08490 [Thermoleophilia bacterium]|nr:hypothetical protein [Thermoleophilia bacterium]
MGYVLNLRRMLLLTTIVLGASMLLAVVPGAARAATLAVPADGAHFTYLELATMVQFDPATDEHPKWVLLATDAAMTTTVRYCRAFTWAATQDNNFHWGCNRWATGVDQYTGADKLVALEEDHVYYWQVVSTDKAGTEIKSAVRSFAIDQQPEEKTVAEVGAQVMGTVFDDGSQLNLGTAAYVNSGVRVKTIASSRVSTYAFRIKVTNLGAADLTRSYIEVKSAAGTRYLKLNRVAGGSQALWILNANERRLKTKRFEYQANLKSTTNGALVKSQKRVVIVKSIKAVPKWTPDK